MPVILSPDNYDLWLDPATETCLSLLWWGVIRWARELTRCRTTMQSVRNPMNRRNHKSKGNCSDPRRLIERSCLSAKRLLGGVR